MLKERLNRSLEEDFHIRYDIPQDMTAKIMNSVYGRMRKREILWKVMAFSFAALFSVGLSLGGWLYSLRPQVKAVFVYPHSGNIKSVEVVGDFGKDVNRVPLELSEDEGIWTKEISIHKQKMPDYEIRVIEKDGNEADKTGEIPDAESL